MPQNPKYNFSLQMTGKLQLSDTAWPRRRILDGWSWSHDGQTCFLTSQGRKEIKMQKRAKKWFWLLFREWFLPKNSALVLWALMQTRTRQTRWWMRGSPVVIVISEAIVSQNHELPHYPRCPGRDNQTSGHQQQIQCHNNTNYHASHNFSTLHSGKAGAH